MKDILTNCPIFGRLSEIFDCMVTFKSKKYICKKWDVMKLSVVESRLVKDHGSFLR